MSEWAAKRFWTAAGIRRTEGGWAIELDGRPVRSPARALLAVPTEPLAAAIAAEWDAQGERIDPAAMPLTRTANSALDKVAAQHGAVVDLLAGYGETDLLCYRAEGPAELAARQGAAWQPWLDWAEAQHGARLDWTTGLLPVAQDQDALARLRAPVAAMDAFALAAFHDLVALSGSLVLALAVADGVLPPRDAFALSRIDEDWQAEMWGQDEEAAEAADARRAAYLDAARFHALATQSAPPKG